MREDQDQYKQEEYESKEFRRFQDANIRDGMHPNDGLIEECDRCHRTFEYPRTKYVTDGICDDCWEEMENESA